ncbi:MAG TPA: YlbF family regulator [Syntrophomonadaceae bacterium]|nr:YlbF family regulator [Syntrophomonadaceae bacterium]
MAVNPYDIAHKLANAITDSEQYQDYVKAKQVIEINPDLMEKVLNLRTKQMGLNRAQMSGEEIPDDVMVQINDEFTELNQIKELADFFDSEGKFIVLFNDIQGIIQKKIEQGLE